MLAGLVSWSFALRSINRVVENPLRAIGAVDLGEEACATFAHNHPNTPVHCDDLLNAVRPDEKGLTITHMYGRPFYLDIQRLQDFGLWCPFLLLEDTARKFGEWEISRSHLFPSGLIPPSSTESAVSLLGNAVSPVQCAVVIEVLLQQLDKVSRTESEEVLRQMVKETQCILGMIRYEEAPWQRLIPRMEPTGQCYQNVQVDIENPEALEPPGPTEAKSPLEPGSMSPVERKDEASHDGPDCGLQVDLENPDALESPGPLEIKSPLGDIDVPLTIYESFPSVLSALRILAAALAMMTSWTWSLSPWTRTETKFSNWSASPPRINLKRIGWMFPSALMRLQFFFIRLTPSMMGYILEMTNSDG